MALAVATTAKTAPVTESVAGFACNADLTSAPEELFDRATRAFIDTIGVAIAGYAEPSFGILAQTVGSSGDLGHATVLPTRARTTAAQAALLHCTARHA